MDYSREVNTWEASRTTCLHLRATYRIYCMPLRVHCRLSRYLRICRVPGNGSSGFSSLASHTQGQKHRFWFSLSFQWGISDVLSHEYNVTSRACVGSQARTLNTSVLRLVSGADLHTLPKLLVNIPMFSYSFGTNANHTVVSLNIY
jgi:hypothetical protein